MSFFAPPRIRPGLKYIIVLEERINRSYLNSFLYLRQKNRNSATRHYICTYWHSNIIMFLFTCCFCTRFVSYNLSCPSFYSSSVFSIVCSHFFYNTVVSFFFSGIILVAMSIYLMSFLAVSSVLILFMVQYGTYHFACNVSVSTIYFKMGFAGDSQVTYIEENQKNV